jgi:cell division protein FtsI (penicillin-binding protein 3)
MNRIIKIVLTASLLMIILGCTNKATISKEKKDSIKAKIDNIIVNANKTFESKDITISVMNSTTGEIIYISDNSKAIKHTFEPGSLIKPISIAIALDKNKVNQTEKFSAYNFTKPNKKGLYKRGKIKVDGWTIGDDHQFDKHYLNLKEIIIHSSNIGTLQIAQRLSAREFLDGFHAFGFTKKTGIDLPYEKVGSLPSYNQLHAGENKGKDNVFKATSSYGMGMRTTFIQLLKAFNVFNNDGKMVTPYINTVPTTNKTQVISKQTANIIKEYLIATVKEGTGKNAYISGIEIGGKTATANKAINGKYKKKYITSFFGFVNTKNNKYTIGVSINEPTATGKHWYYYYASNSAVPVFKDVVKAIIE